MPVKCCIDCGGHFRQIFLEERYLRFDDQAHQRPALQSECLHLQFSLFSYSLLFNIPAISFIFLSSFESSFPHIGNVRNPKDWPEISLKGGWGGKKQIVCLNLRRVTEAQACHWRDAFFLWILNNTQCEIKCKLYNNSRRWEKQTFGSLKSETEKESF